MASIIFYGAGENARLNFNRWYESGLVPVCFVDKKVEMHHTFFDIPDGSKFEILSIVEAISKYPDYVLYCTQIESNLGNVTEDLLGAGIPKERIRYCDGFAEARYCKDYLSCSFINIESYRDGRVYYGSCCGVFWRQYRFLSSGDFEKDYSHLLEHISKHKLLLKEGYYNRCHGCSSLKKLPDNGYPVPFIKHRFDFSTGCVLDGDLCNLKCIYCGYPHIHREKYKQMEGKITNGLRYDLLKSLQYIERNFAAEDVMIDYCAAEIGVQKRHNEEVLDIWNKNNWKGEIASNATVYLSGIATLLEKNLISLLTSPDAGTPETYYRIKGVDLFDRMVGNLKEYAKTGGGILRVKYIILEGINDNYNEMDKFLDIIEELSNTHPNVVIPLSRDMRHSRYGVNEHELEAFKYLIKMTKLRGLKCQPQTQTFSQADLDKIYADN